MKYRCGTFVHLILSYLFIECFCMSEVLLADTNGFVNILIRTMF